METTKSFKAILVLAGALFLFYPLSSMAIPYTFYNITNNGNYDLSGQLYVDVTDPGSNQVLFTFYNKGSITSSITDVYFDDGNLISIAAITSSIGVSFNDPAVPSNLPGGNNIIPNFVTTDNLCGFRSSHNGEWGK